VKKVKNARLRLSQSLWPQAIRVLGATQFEKLVEKRQNGRRLQLGLRRKGEHMSHRPSAIRAKKRAGCQVVPMRTVTVPQKQQFNLPLKVTTWTLRAQAAP